MASTKPRNGGCHTHRPGCRCRPCTGKRIRQEKALTGRAGSPDFVTKPEQPVAVDVVIDADQPLVVKERGPKAVLLEWAALRAAEPNLTSGQIADRLGIGRESLATILYRAKKKGLLKYESPTLILETEIVPKVVRNLNHWLDRKDRSVTVEAAKGLIFPQYRESHGIHDHAPTVLALKIELPPHANQPDGTINTGIVLGTPKKA